MQEEIEGMIERRVHDFRLDSRLRTHCEADIYSMCAFFGVGVVQGSTHTHVHTGLPPQRLTP